ncbi:hypothetical protein PybrP1_008764 [[Pythium] brassicae (nom. inval.)]|nr:hypothetical protein PybrP1_008764 [[Pythium] brassicae (nom. inval.)]
MDTSGGTEPSRSSGGAALPGFVSTSVLTSSDGLFGDNVEEQRIADAPAAPRAQDADYRPLYDRLQELKERKDNEWREKNNPFAPPKALDEEEISFLRDLEERQAESQQRRKEQHDEDRAGFLLAKQQASAGTAAGAAANSSSSTTTGSSSSASAPAVATTTVLSEEARLRRQSQKAPVVVRAKRKAPAAQDSNLKASAVKKKTKKTKQKHEDATQPPPSGDDRPDAAPDATAREAAKAPVSNALGLVAYGSDSDSE